MALIDVNWHPGRRDLRGFGFICLVAFGALGTWLFLRHSIAGFELDPDLARRMATGAWGVAGVSLVLAIVAPTWLRPLYVTLTAISLPIGFVLSHVVMAVLYYGILTPVGLYFRITGRDALSRSIDREAESYWEPRRQAERAQYFRQF